MPDMTSTGGGLGRRLAANTLHAATGRVVAIALWLLLTPSILRALGPEGFAVWSLFFALTGYLAAFDFGLAQVTLRHVPAARARGDHAEAGEFATMGIIGYAALGVIWLALTPLLREPVLAFLHVPDYVHDAASFAFVAGSVVFAVSGFTNVIVAVAQGYDRFDLGNLISLSSSLGQMVGILISLSIHAGLVGLVCSSGAGWALAAMVGAIVLRVNVHDFRWGSPLRAVARLREALAFGGPMQVANVLSVAHQQLDKVLLARFVSLASVTPYELGLRVATSASTFPQLLLLAAIPAASAMHSGENPERLQELYRRANRYVLFAAVVVGAALLGAADQLFTAWLGAPHPDAAMALRGLTLTSLVALATGMGSAIARGIGRTVFEAEFAAVALSVHLCAGIPLTMRFGLRGALLAIFAGNACGAAWFLWRIAGAMRWPRSSVLIEPFAIPLLAGALGAAAAFALERVLPASVGLVAWAGALACALVAAAVVALVALGTGYISLAEALMLVPRAGKRG